MLMGSYPIKGVLGSGFLPSLSLSLSLSHCFDEVTQFNPTSESDEEVLANIARLSSVAMCWVNIFFNSKFLVLLFDLIQGNL